MKKHNLLSLALTLTLPATALAQFDVPNTFQAGTPARASEVNQNFTTLSGHLSALDQRIADLPQAANIVTVATSGADFDSISAALASITTASANNRFLVKVAPGVYTETSICVIPSFVVLEGSGAEVTVLRTSRSGNAPNDDAAAVDLREGAALCDLTVQNSGNGAISIGVVTRQTSRMTSVRDVRILVDGNGGSGHFAIHASDSDLFVNDSFLSASGSTLANTAYGSVDSGGPFAQPLIVNSFLSGQGPASGFGMQLSNTAASVRGGEVHGDMRAISANVNGISRVIDTTVRSLGLNPVYEQSGASAVLSAGVFFIGGNPTGLASQFRYVHCYKANFNPVVNGDGSSVQ